MPAELQATRQETTLILTFSNPGAGNALHPDLCAGAIESLSTAERDPSVRAVVLTGADQYFCSGSSPARLADARHREKSAQEVSVDMLRGLIDAIRESPKPVLAAIEGGAAGAGFSIALACDFIISAVSARFNMPEARFGLTPEGGASWFLTQALPRQLALEILLSTQPVTARRLYDVGLINRLCEDGGAVAAALSWAEEIAALLSPNAVERTKVLAAEAIAVPLAVHLATEKSHFIESLGHRDALEGISAMFEKRKPAYK